MWSRILTTAFQSATAMAFAVCRVIVIWLSCLSSFHQSIKHAFSNAGIESNVTLVIRNYLRTHRPLPSIILPTSGFDSVNWSTLARLHRKEL